ncbi:hypothetical protein SCA6_010144 [Theobroma cacao]
MPFKNLAGELSPSDWPTQTAFKTVKPSKTRHVLIVSTPPLAPAVQDSKPKIIQSDENPPLDEVGYSPSTVKVRYSQHTCTLKMKVSVTCDQAVVDYVSIFLSGAKIREVLNWDDVSRVRIL